MFGLPKRSGKLKNLSEFDASFFGVSPKQANSMDPQLRLLLELTHEAIVDAGENATTKYLVPTHLKHLLSSLLYLNSRWTCLTPFVWSPAGISPQSLRGSRTGVFIGVSQSESDTKFSEDPDLINGYGLTGTNRAMFANRVSYTFNFTG